MEIATRSVSFDETVDALADVGHRELLVALLAYDPQDDAPGAADDGAGGGEPPCRWSTSACRS